MLHTFWHPEAVQNQARLSKGPSGVPEDFRGPMADSRLPLTPAVHTLSLVKPRSFRKRMPTRWLLHRYTQPSSTARHGAVKGGATTGAQPASQTTSWWVTGDQATYPAMGNRRFPSSSDAAAQASTADQRFPSSSDTAAQASTADLGAGRPGKSRFWGLYIYIYIYIKMAPSYRKTHWVVRSLSVPLESGRGARKERGTSLATASPPRSTPHQPRRCLLGSIGQHNKTASG